jgi:putative endonuclease
MADHLLLGKWGEDIAENKLREIGWKILERNISFRCGELDIVALDDDEMVMVEVRTRTVGEMMPPECSVGPRKLRKLVNAGKYYVMKNKWDGPWRIDLMAVTVENEEHFRVERYQDITAGEFY